MLAPGTRVVVEIAAPPKPPIAVGTPGATFVSVGTPDAAPQAAMPVTPVSRPVSNEPSSCTLGIVACCTAFFAPSLIVACQGDVVKQATSAQQGDSYAQIRAKHCGAAVGAAAFVGGAVACCKFC